MYIFAIMKWAPVLCIVYYVFVYIYSNITVLVLKQLEMYGCIFSTVATDALLWKHQAISIQSADQISIDILKRLT